MNKLEKYLDSNDNQKVPKQILEQYKYYGFNSELDFKTVLEFLMENVYNFVYEDNFDNKKVRPDQKKFREELMKKYNKSCVITGDKCLSTLKGCHIIEVNDNGNFDVDNGLLLRSDIHDSFDAYLWAINPETLLIETKQNIDVGEISKFAGNKVKLNLNPTLKYNLNYRYNLFITKNK